MAKVKVRRARRGDSEQFLSLLGELARFEKLEPPSEEAKSRILRDVFDKDKLRLVIAEVGEEPVGYALYFYTYSSFLARPTLYLEDLYVKEGHRREGAGMALFSWCAREALAERCGRMEWAVLRWNQKAAKFYESLGARKLDEWEVFRLDEERLGALVRRSD
ncbi:MAG: GNAT family N-acetyltransferase [archaeon]|nr:MAG: GNAT family N-acetyltransferase [archaeon]